MTVSDYKRIFKEILEISYDVESNMNLSNLTDKDLEKCKFIAAMLEVLNDVPERRTYYVFKLKRINFNYIEFSHLIDD